MDKLLDIREIIKQLAKCDIHLKEGAIRQYVKDGLACEPAKEGRKGKGQKALYPSYTASEVGASYRLINKFTGLKDKIARARKIAIHLENMNPKTYNDMRNDKFIISQLREQEFMAYLTGEWLRLKQTYKCRASSHSPGLKLLGELWKAQDENNQEEIDRVQKEMDKHQKEDLEETKLAMLYPYLAMIATCGTFHPDEYGINFHGDITLKP